MNKPRPSIFRDALQISSECIAAMNEEDLNKLMTQLLIAQAYRCDSQLNKICVNTEVKAKDDGCDAWSPKPKINDRWLGNTVTCWQFKTRKAGNPARLKGEVTKPIPKKTLANGGRFVVVTSGSTNGKKGEADRLAILIKEAKTAKLPTSRIEVVGSERLAIWCNQHPAIAAYWSGKPSGLWTLESWMNSDEHQVPWQAAAPIHSEIVARRADLDFASRDILHLHIQGPPGVGKTRFALELCREAAWSSTVIYIPQVADIRLNELIDCSVTDEGIRLIVVADEVQSEQLQLLRASVGRGNGRVRLITVGHCSTPDSTRIPTLPVKPLDHQLMEKVIKGWYQSMPPEHIDFVARFADGYVRLARLAADAVYRNPTMDVRGLLNQDDIRSFLDRMLGSTTRSHLYVVAVLTKVGWTDDKQVEGEAIARHFDMEWNSVRSSIEEFHRLYGIVPRGGRYRYISPSPLGIYLAIEAWNTFPDQMKSLPDVLPSDESKDSYYDRLKSIASNYHAREFAREELTFFFQAKDFVSDRAVRRWAALSAADTVKATHNILEALIYSSLEDRKQIAGQARRIIVWTLVRLAWNTSSFHDAVMVLALLAEAENETWANNATSEFIAKYNIFLSGTAVPYLDRLSVLDELFALKRPSLLSLVIRALAQIGNKQAFRIVGGPASDELPEIEWQPRNGQEYFECVKSAILRLSDIAKIGETKILVDLIDAVDKLSMMLLESQLRALIIGFFEAIRGAYPEAREPIRKIIAGIILHEKKYWKKLSIGDFGKLESLHSQFEDSSLGARLQQYVGIAFGETKEQPDLKSLATELQSIPEALAKHWPWLTSGNAADAWRLGKTLAEVDSEGKLILIFPQLHGTGDNLQLICGYINVKRQGLGDSWYDEWIAMQFEQDPKPVTLLFEIARSCGITNYLANKLAEILNSVQVSPEIVGRLGYGYWDERIAHETVETLIKAMAESGHYETAISILDHRMKCKSDEIIRWKPLALKLVTTPKLIRSGHMVTYHWDEVSKILITENPGEIASAILREHANYTSPRWYIEHSHFALQIFQSCAKQAPNAIWREIQPYLSSSTAASRFSIGFPKGIIHFIPASDIFEWIEEKPIERALIVSKFISANFSTDETLASQLLDKYGDNKTIADIFFIDYASGSWMGPASSHWNSLADNLDKIVSRTKLPKIRNWARVSALALRDRARREQRREEEEEIDEK